MRRTSSPGARKSTERMKAEPSWQLKREGNPPPPPLSRPFPSTNRPKDECSAVSNFQYYITRPIRLDSPFGLPHATGHLSAKRPKTCWIVCIIWGLQRIQEWDRAGLESDRCCSQKNQLLALGRTLEMVGLTLVLSLATMLHFLRAGKGYYLFVEVAKYMWQWYLRM